MGSMENELKRIADCLGRIEGKMMGTGAIPTVGLAVEAPVGRLQPTQAVPEAPKKKAKGVVVRDVTAEVVAEPVAVEVTVEKAMTAQEFLAKCNKEISLIADKKVMGAKVTKLKDAFKKEFGVVSILSIPDKQIPEANAIFCKVMAEAV